MTAADQLRTDSAERPRTIAFMNSLATTTRIWDGVIAALPDDYRTVRYDQRDRNGADARGPFELDDLVDDLIQTLDDAEAERAHVVGVSLGGLVALRAAFLHAERFASLTAMCCAARFSRETWIERERTVRDGGVEPIVPGVIDRWFTREYQRRNPEVVRTYTDMLASTDSIGYAHACRILAESDVRKELPGIHQPTLVVSGEFDTANPVADQALIAERVPQARHVTLPDTAHLAPVTAPVEVAALIHEHIQSAEARRARLAFHPAPDTESKDS